MPHIEQFDSSGNHLPSVTEVLEVINKPHLYEWYGRMGLKRAQAIKESSAHFGRNVHEGIEVMLKKERKDLKLSSEEKEKVKEVKEWRERTEFNPLYLEFSSKSDILGFSGTCDAIGVFPEDEERLVLIDWKTSRYLAATFGIQLGGYALLAEENLGKNIDIGAIVHLPKKGHLGYYKYPRLKEYKEAFLTCLKLYKYLKHEEERLGFSTE